MVAAMVSGGNDTYTTKTDMNRSSSTAGTESTEAESMCTPADVYCIPSGRMRPCSRKMDAVLHAAPTGDLHTGFAAIEQQLAERPGKYLRGADGRDLRVEEVVHEAFISVEESAQPRPRRRRPAPIDNHLQQRRPMIRLIGSETMDSTVHELAPRPAVRPTARLRRACLALRLTHAEGVDSLISRTIIRRIPGDPGHRIRAQAHVDGRCDVISRLLSSDSSLRFRQMARAVRGAAVARGAAADAVDAFEASLARTPERRDALEGLERARERGRATSSRSGVDIRGESSRFIKGQCPR
jgi:hypothetical protein